MTIYRGAHYSMTLTLKSNVSGDPLDITGWQFQCQIRDAISDEAIMVELTSANGGINTLSPPTAGQIELVITADQNRDFSLGSIIGDVFRTDVVPGPIRLFGFKDKVRKSVTREDTP